jgi:hypothetical protein
MPATATVRIHDSTRDQLRALAERRHATMPALLAELTQAELDRQMIADHCAVVDAMTPEQRADYHAELTAWDSTLLDGLEDEPPYPVHEDQPGAR